MKLDILCLRIGIVAGLFILVESAGYIEIGNLPATVSVFEDAAGSTFLYSVVFYQSPNVGTVTCSFDDVQTQFSIAIGSGGGQYLVTLAASPTLVFTTTSTYLLDITCSDVAGNSASDTLTVDLIQNVAPVFTNLPGTVDVSAKTTKAGMNIFTISYTDTDSPSPLVQQSITLVSPTQPVTDFFTIANDMLKVTENLTDYDDEAQYVVTISVGDEKNIISETITVNIYDRNTPPEFVTGVNPDDTITLPEFTAGRLLVYDIDTYDGEGDVVQMTEETSNGDFELAQATGEISLLGGVTLDYETTPSYTIKVSIRDYIDPQTTSTFTLTINVSDINEQPTFADTPSPVTMEETATGTIVGTLDQLCTDPDGVPPDTTSYTILFSTESVYFTIDSTTPEVSLAQDYDYDDVNLANEVNLTVRCFDTDGLSDDTTYTITFTDINDNNPICSPSVTSFSLNYAQTVNETLVNVDCSDIDSTVNAELEYSIVGLSTGYSTDYFQVDTYGNVSISHVFEMDYNTSFYVTILVNDKGTNPGPLSATVTLTVTYTEAPTITTYEEITECFLCTTSAITLISVVCLVVFMFLVTCVVYVVLKCAYGCERKEMFFHLNLSKLKKASWRWCGCLRPGELKKKKRSRNEIMLAEKRDQEYIRARNALLGVNDEPGSANDSLKTTVLPGPSSSKPHSKERRHGKKPQSGGSGNGIQNLAYLGRDKTPDISATPVDRKGLTHSQKVQLEKFQQMKKPGNAEVPSTSKTSQAGGGMTWAFEGR